MNNNNPFLPNRGAGGRTPGQQQSSHQLPQTLGLGLDLPRVIAQVKQNQLRRQQMAGEAPPQPREHKAAPVRRNSTMSGSGLPSHMDEQRKSVLANILKAIKGPEKSRRDSADAQNSSIPVSENSAFKRLQPSVGQTAPGPQSRQVARPNTACTDQSRVGAISSSIQATQVDNPEMPGPNARAETVRQLHQILQKMVTTRQQADDASVQADSLSTMLAQSGLSADVLTMLLLKTNENTEAPNGPGPKGDITSPILNPIKAIKTSIAQQKPAGSSTGQEKELTQIFRETPPLFGRVAPAMMLSAAKVSQTPSLLGIQGTSRFMSGRDRAQSGNLMDGNYNVISDASMAASVSHAEPRARSTEIVSVADNSEEPPKATIRSASNEYGSIGSSDYVRDRPLTIEEKRQRILRHWERKRVHLQAKKEVRYVCRKDLADKRFRYRGRFISQEQKEKILAEDSGAFDIYDPNNKCTPRSKQIFKVERHRRSTSSCSSECPSRRKSTSREESKETGQQAIPVQPMNLFTGVSGIDAPTMAAGVHGGSLFAGRPSSGLFGKIGNLGQQLASQPNLISQVNNMPQTNIGVLTDEQMTCQKRLFPPPQEPMNIMQPVIEAHYPADEDFHMHDENNSFNPMFQ